MLDRIKGSHHHVQKEGKIESHKSNEGLDIPMPRKSVKGRSIAEVSPDPKIALAFLIRKERIEAKMSQSEAAKRLGIKHADRLAP